MITKQELLKRLNRLEDLIAGNWIVTENTTLLHMQNRMEEIRQEVINIMNDLNEEKLDDECSDFVLSSSSADMLKDCCGDGWYRCKECIHIDKENSDMYLENQNDKV